MQEVEFPVFLPYLVHLDKSTLSKNFLLRLLLLAHIYLTCEVYDAKYEYSITHFFSTWLYDFSILRRSSKKAIFNPAFEATIN